MSDRRKAEVIVPGEKIGVIEEFVAGEGTVENEDGEIRSKALGRLGIDRKTREARVRPFKAVDELKEGDTVLCEVVDVQARLAFVEIISSNGVPLRNRFPAIIFMPFVRGHQYSTPLGIGDLVLAEVSSLFEGRIDLSVRSRSCGAILASCEFCCVPLSRVARGLRCPKCGRIQRRMIVDGYGNREKLRRWLGLG